MDRFEETKSPPPASALLQDLLREKRATQSSPLASNPVTLPTMERSAKYKRESSGFRDKGTVPAEMGLREMDEYINKIKKENIDLKFELFHRRQRSEELEVKLEKMKVAEINLKATNEKLRQDVETRNTAIKEAVDEILNLEARIALLKSSLSIHGAARQQPNLTLADLDGDIAERTPIQPAMESDSYQVEESPNQVATKNKDIILPSTPSPQDEIETDDIPERLYSPWRAPSFLEEQNENTQALRSLYQASRNDSHLNPSLFSLSPPGSLYTLDDEYDGDPDRYVLNSPRLSLLSESSIFSVYRPKKVEESSPPKNDTTHSGSLEGDEINSQKRHPQDLMLDEAEIQKWIDDKNKGTAFTRKPQKDAAIDKFSSIDEVLEKAPIHSRENRNDQSPQPKPAGTLSRKTGGNFSRKNEKEFSRKDDEVLIRKNDDDTLRKKGHVVSSSFGGPIFSQSVLPPTPDTMSTDHREPDISIPNIITERSLADRTSFRPEKLRYDSPTYHHTEKHTRPQLSNYATDIMFNGHDDFPPTQATQPTRTMSYPSPTEGKRRRSVQFPAPGKEASEISYIRTSSMSPTKITDGRRDTPTPPPAPSSHRLDSKLPQSSSMRIKNLLFGRSNSQSGQSSAHSTDPTPARPSSRNFPSLSHPRRPSSIYLANTSKPLPDPNASLKIGRSASAKMRDGLRGIQTRK